MLRDLADPDDEQVAATIAVIAAADADVLVLQGIDFDAGALALDALAARLSEIGHDYPHRLTLRPNTGWPTGQDIDGDGWAHGPRDAHGYGRFSGQGGMAVLSRHPIGTVRDFTGFLWRDLPDHGAAGLITEGALEILRLHPVAAWDVTIELPNGPFHLLTMHASPPVFDGPEDRNGRRNADELRFWQLYLDGWAPDGGPFDGLQFALVGTLNVDRERGEGRRGPLRALLDHPRLQDPAPTGAGGSATADWSDPVPGDLRVDYILPAAGLEVCGSGVLWPDETGDPLPADIVAAASDHRLVWVDLELQRLPHDIGQSGVRQVGQ